MRGRKPGEKQSLKQERLDPNRLPRHVAIIMDGNGRWAQARNLPRVEGHRAGVAAVRRTVEAAAELGIEYLTLYAFSAENWKRPRAEVWTLMNLLKDYLRRDVDTLVAQRIRFQPIGRWREMDPSVVEALERVREATAKGTGMHLNIALNYSGRAEIVDACRKIVSEWAAGRRVNIDEATLNEALYTAGQPDPDLLIRTSGELRISNFLLWQLAYTELWVTPTFWPDFGKEDLLAALIDYQSRVRRFGGLEACEPPRRDGNVGKLVAG
jgi:undecaprenyl diphosphate synthase